MAKIKARGCTEVARFKTKERVSDRGTKVTSTYVLRSDGAVLRSTRYVPADGSAFSDPLTIHDRVGAGADAAFLRRYLTNRGIEVA